MPPDEARDGLVRRPGVLFVCTGNICRSPTAEGVFTRMLSDAGLRERVHVDSAGTHSYHAGEPPDARSVAAAGRRGYDLSGLRARRLARADFNRFDWIIAMDRGHLQHMARLVQPSDGHKIKLMLAYARGDWGESVPDPYYGAGDGFERVLDMLEDACAGLLAEVRTTLR